MIWPSLCVDNFFDNPEKVVKFSNTLKYTPYGGNEVPHFLGQRSENIQKINAEFFEVTTRKILSLLYPTESTNLLWGAAQYFQKIPANCKDSPWVHTDHEFEFTTIIYLSPETEWGTIIFEPKECYGYFKNNMKDNNSGFKESIKFNSKFNRFIMFDGANYHAQIPFINKDKTKERLTLITFFSDVRFLENKRLNKPITTMRRIR